MPREPSVPASLELPGGAFSAMVWLEDVFFPRFGCMEGRLFARVESLFLLKLNVRGFLEVQSSAARRGNARRGG
jgi:hypothetical protein